MSFKNLPTKKQFEPEKYPQKIRTLSLMKKGTVRKKNVFHEFIAAKMGEWGKKTLQEIQKKQA